MDIKKKLTLGISGLTMIIAMEGCKIVPSKGVLIGEICNTPYDKYPKNHPCYEINNSNYQDNGGK